MAVEDIVFTEGERQNFIVEVPEGTAQSLVNIETTTNTNQDALVNELQQPPVPIVNRRKVR